MIYRAEKSACRAFPDPRDAGLAAGTKRNFQILSALEFLAEFTQHIPPKGAHLIRYYGWYSNKSRGMRRKAAAALAPPMLQATAARGRCDETWAMLIKRVYEVDPLACPQCGGTMEVIAFIEPPQGKVIERILRHCGLWRERESSPRGPPGDCPDFRATTRSVGSKMGLSPLHDQPAEGEESPPEVRELTFVDEATFWATF